MRWLALIGAAVAAATAMVYVILLAGQGPPVFLPTVLLALAMMLALVALPLYGVGSASPERRALALWAAVPGFFGFGALAAWSIGGLLLLGSVPTLIAAALSLRGVTLRARPAITWGLGLVVAWAAALGLLLLLAQLSAGVVAYR